MQVLSRARHTVGVLSEEALGGGCTCWTLGVTCFQNLCPALGGLPRLLGQAGALPPGADTEAAGPHQGRAPLRRGAAQGAQKGVCGGHCAARWRGRQGLERSQNFGAFEPLAPGVCL